MRKRRGIEEVLIDILQDSSGRIVIDHDQLAADLEAAVADARDPGALAALNWWISTNPGVLPEWIVTAFLPAYLKGAAGGGSWDDVFGKPITKRRAAAMERRWRSEWEVHQRVKDRAPGVSVADAVREAGKALGLCETIAWAAYRRRQEFLQALQKKRGTF